MWRFWKVRLYNIAVFTLITFGAGFIVMGSNVFGIYPPDYSVGGFVWWQVALYMGAVMDIWFIPINLLAPLMPLPKWLDKKKAKQ